MENNHKLALYVSYYLSRFNKVGLKNLGYSNWLSAYKDISARLDVKPNTVKNMRDEYDPLFGNRAGWHQRSMSKSRVQLLQALENLDEYQLRLIVKDILSGEIDNDPNDAEQLLNIIIDDDKDDSKNKFILRAPTGKSAEEYFIKYYRLIFKSLQGELKDCRDQGVGYDFKIVSKNDFALIEVKGLSDINGGILLTNKEWLTAQENKSNYYIVIISNLSEKPKLKIIQNPAYRVIPKRNIYTTIQVSWTISDKQLKEIND